MKKIIIAIITMTVLVTAITLGFNLTELKPEPKNYNDVVISLERTGCQIPCPIYSVTIFEDGTVIYEGKQFVENIGTYQYNIPRYNVERLIDKFHDINFFALDDSYDSDVFDLPTVVTTFQTDSYQKTVSNYGEAGPDSLKELERLIDRFAESHTINETMPENESATLSIHDMKPNSMEFFYYPNPDKTENRDPFQRFILIRLPEWLGGNENNTSAFRAYSAVSLTDHCLVKYWPEPGRQRMENPCRGEIYRVIDGLMIVGTDPMTNTAPISLPKLDLTVDENGLLFVDTPTWTPQKNGVISIGREMSIQHVRQGSETMVESFKKLNPNFPDIPVTFAGHTLSNLSPEKNSIDAWYVDFPMFTSGSYFLSIGLTGAQDQSVAKNLAWPDSEFWQIGKNVIRVTGSKLEENQYQHYEIVFLKDSHTIRFEGSNMEFMKKEIVSNYFPEYNYDDMFLISRTADLK